MAAPGLISALGVKFTGARALAEAAVDAALRRLGRPKVASRTETVALHRAAPSTGSLEDAARAAVREEMAVHLTDAVLRRLDLGTAGPPGRGRRRDGARGDGVGARMGRGDAREGDARPLTPSTRERRL